MDSASIVAISAAVTALTTGVMIWAVYVAPQKASEAQWKLPQRHEARQRRMGIFTTLMATRANALHYRHVALNLIDVEFIDASEKDVREAWKAYLDHLNTLNENEPDEAKRDQREQRRQDLLAELLQKIGARLGYNFDFTYLKGRAYYPMGPGKTVEEESAVRRGLIKMLWKGRPLMVAPRPKGKAPYFSLRARRIGSTTRCPRSLAHGRR